MEHKGTDGELWMCSFFQRPLTEGKLEKLAETAPSVASHLVSRGLLNQSNSAHLKLGEYVYKLDFVAI